MPLTVNVHDAKTHFSRLLEQAHAGQEIILAKAGKPYARLMPLAPPAASGSPVESPAGWAMLFSNPCLLRNSMPGKANEIPARYPCLALVADR